jgi:hypothetical protein
MSCPKLRNFLALEKFQEIQEMKIEKAKDAKGKRCKWQLASFENQTATSNITITTAYWQSSREHCKEELQHISYRKMPKLKETDEQVCSECRAELGVEFAKVSPCHHCVCFRCLSRLLAVKSSTKALMCPSCSEIVEGHTECCRDDDEDSNVVNYIKHSTSSKAAHSPEKGDDEASEGRKLIASPRRMRRTKSRMRVLKSLDEDEQHSEHPRKEGDVDHSERTAGATENDGLHQKIDLSSYDSPTNRKSHDDEEITQSRHSGKQTLRSHRSPSSRRLLSPDKKPQSRSRCKSDNPDDINKPRRRSKSLNSSRHGHLRPKSIMNSEHGDDGHRRRRTSSGESSAQSGTSKKSSRSNGEKRRSSKGHSKHGDPSSKSTRDDDTCSSNDKLVDLIDEEDLTANESDSIHGKETQNENTADVEPSESAFDPSEANATNADKGRKLVNKMKAIAKLAMMGKSLSQSPSKSTRNLKGISLNSEHDDSERGLLD